MINKIYSEIKHFIIQEKYFVLFVLLFLMVTNVPLPYSIYKTGGTIEIGSRIELPYETKEKGSFHLMYVSELSGNGLTVLLSYLLPNWDLVSNEEITYEEMTLEETRDIDKLMYEEAVQNALFYAYQKAGKPIKITNYHHYVIDRLEEADTDLDIKDEILTIDGSKFQDLDEYKAILDKHNIGDKLYLEVLNKEGEKEHKYVTIMEKNERKVTGIYIVTKYDYKATPEITFEEENTEYGPSGGFMMSLAIYDKLVEKDLTHGLKIAGTGTIDQDGNVGAIGGLKYKMLGAEKDNVDLLFVPNDTNYKEAIEIKEEYHLTFNIVGVSTLDDAVVYLEQL